MEDTINLPDRIFANLPNAANKSHRRIDDVSVEKIERKSSVDTEDFTKQIAACTDKEILELSEPQMPPKQDRTLSNLLQKQSERDLTDDEQKKLWHLMELNRLTTLKNAFALCEISRRGLMKKIEKDLDEIIRRQAKNRCGYCLNPQKLIPYKLEIEHLLPKALGGGSTEENLWLACRECNAHKAKKTKVVDTLTGKTVKLFNPRRQN